MEILHQLGNLFLQAVPTVIIVFLFYLFMRWAFFTPIQKAMAEREAKIEGARKDAATVQAAANQDLQDYNDALKKARAEIYAEQEVARQAILQERSKNLKAMRTLAQKEVAEGKKKIDADLAVARKEIEASAPAMAGEIARSILEKPLSLQGETRRS
ncbi:MAG: ATP synthase F0 subunit B [Candidatus Acidiferrales bacterium]|jgi:F0F1-type ATP synthase membrane subunit b/b'